MTRKKDQRTVRLVVAKLRQAEGWREIGRGGKFHFAFGPKRWNELEPELLCGRKYARITPAYNWDARCKDCEWIIDNL